VSLYAMVFGGLLIVGGRLADRYGRRRILHIGLVLFALASLFTGLAVHPVMLFAGRIVLGAAAALVSPAALALTLTIFEAPDDRQRALAVWGAVAAVGGVAGLILGGALTATVGWRWVFFVDVVPALVVAAIGARRLPESTLDDAPAVAVGGAALLLAAMSALVVALTAGATSGWGAPLTIGLLLLAISAAAGFALAERRRPDPLIDWTLFHDATVRNSNVAAAVLSALIVGQGVFVSIHLQTNAGYSPLRTGAALAPLTAVAALASFRAGRVIDRVGLRLAGIASFLLIGIGYLGLARLDGVGSYPVELLPALVVLGAGIGVGFVTATIGATATVPDRQRGVASGAVSTAQQLGAAVGIGALGAITAATTDPTFATTFAAGALLAVSGAAVSASIPTPTPAARPRPRAHHLTERTRP
jgi:MFS family permease